ncbi:MAG: YdeI/OmpD-associated family protein [Cytophagaceae bacterium]|nr:YdeI/OmpD-associated family protein [Cytophagaceae bacterium]
MPNPLDQLETFLAHNRQEWREWLQTNYRTSRGIWLIFYKKASGKPRIMYSESVEEALCYGWIDSLPRKLDAERSMLVFTPRKPKSPWSKLNKQRIITLIEQNLMTEAGLRKIEAARQDGSWTMLDAVEELTIPADLRAALAANPVANDYFTAFNKSSKKGILWWIESAKRPETRQKRIEETVTLAARNAKAR